MQERLQTKQVGLHGVFQGILAGLATAGFSTALWGAPPALPPSLDRKVDFATDVRPLLQDRCYKCHGPEKQKGGLRLDSKAAVMRGGDSGPVVVPGKAAESPLVTSLVSADPDKIMPPKGEPLSAAQIALVKTWVEQGAVWPVSEAGNAPSHWAFRTPQRPAKPHGRANQWPRTGVDQFILARLEKEGLQPSPEADRTTLIRRVSLDLTGLPPTPAEIDQYLADSSPGAYTNLVEKLLASPHYGERWGRWWLDAARYADSNGYEKDLARSIWPYRDYVIQAFNRDLPFDRFTLEQLAGDLLPHPTLEQRIATGFLRNSMLNEEGGIDPETFRLEGLLDRMDTLGKAYLGMPLNCGQCHNLKYDPITQREYYQMFAMLNNDDEPEIEVPSPDQIRQRETILRKIADLEDKAMAADAGCESRVARWESSVKDAEGDWEILEPVEWHGTIGAKLDKLDDHSLLAGGSNPHVSEYTITVRTRRTGITGFRLETLTHPNLRRHGPGRSREGRFVLSEFSVLAAPMDNPQATNAVPLHGASADFSQPGFPVAHAIDGSRTNGWAVDAGPGQRNQDRKAVFQARTPVGYGQGTLLTFVLHQNAGGEQTIGRLRIALTTKPDPTADPVPARVRDILRVSSSQRSAQQNRELFSYYRTTDSSFDEVNKSAAALWKDWPYGATTLALQSRPHPRKTHVFKRGELDRPTDEVQPGVPAVLNPLPSGSPGNRLALAKWLVDPNNPLTARVIVNRIWQVYFGTGLVSTPEDFGSRGDAPSHPDLLDWLACEFMKPAEIPGASPWSIKHLHRLIVLSSTYRQSSRATPELLARDPYNRLLARATRQRVEAEIIRDIALTASGLLSRRVGGPSVYPPIPDGVLSLGYGSPMPWPTSTGEDRYRRGMYTFWKRNVPYPAQLAFDAPSGEKACIRRIRSNTPLQALTGLNDQTFHEFAQALGLRIYKEGGPNDRDRLSYGFRLCTGRMPDSTELQRLEALLRQQGARFEENTAGAVQVAAMNLTNPPPNVNLHKVAAYTMVARTLLNMDETLTRE